LLNYGYLSNLRRAVDNDCPLPRPLSLRRGAFQISKIASPPLFKERGLKNQIIDK
jgi:hypothetical protein